jgi:hypothetical protein
MMMGRMMARLAAAALVAGTAAGLAMTLTVALGAMLGATGFPAATILAAALAAGLGLGVLVASWPAFVGGAAMWALGRRFEAARRAPAWAAAGAGAGALLWTLVAGLARVRIGEPGLIEPQILLGAIAAGGSAALAFRAVCRPEARP